MAVPFVALTPTPPSEKVCLTNTAMPPNPQNPTVLVTVELYPDPLLYPVEVVPESRESGIGGVVALGMGVKLFRGLEVGQLLPDPGREEGGIIRRFDRVKKRKRYSDRLWTPNDFFLDMCTSYAFPTLTQQTLSNLSLFLAFEEIPLSLFLPHINPQTVLISFSFCPCFSQNPCYPLRVRLFRIIISLRSLRKSPAQRRSRLSSSFLSPLTLPLNCTLRCSSPLLPA